MREFLLRLWRDEDGFVTVDWSLLTTILVLGAITGAVLTRQVPLADPDEAPPAEVR